MKDLNFIPKSYIQAKVNRKRKVLIVLVFSLSFFLLSSMICIPFITKINLEKERDKLLQEVKYSSNYEAVEKQFNSIKKSFDKRLENGQKMSALGEDITYLIRKIEKASPDRLFFMNLNLTAGFDSSSISLSGLADSEDAIATFISYIRKDGYFNDITLKNVNKDSSSEARTGKSVFKFNIDLICTEKNNEDTGK